MFSIKRFRRNSDTQTLSKGNRKIHEKSRAAKPPQAHYSNQPDSPQSSGSLAWGERIPSSTKQMFVGRNTI